MNGAWWSVCVVLALVLCGGRLAYRQYYGRQDCEMTYMYQQPQYHNVPLPQEVKVQYSRYSLHYYYESHFPLDHLPLPLRGVPALFVPGNAGSYKQARSSASIALRMHSSDFPEKKKFDFFTINFDEELSGMFGGVLETQTEYLRICIRHILSLYSGIKPRPQDVIIIGHSMGGVISRGLFSEPNFNRSHVNTIIALSSPLLRPVLNFDPLLQQYYEKFNEQIQLDHHHKDDGGLTLVSISGGNRDVMVPTHLSVLPPPPPLPLPPSSPPPPPPSSPSSPSSPSVINIATPSVPRNWASADHLAVVWCRRVQLALTRGLFLLQDERRRALSRNSTRRYDTFHHLVTRGKEIPLPNHNLQFLNLKDIFFSNETELHLESFKKGYKYAATPIPTQGHAPSIQLLLASNTRRASWIHICSISEDKCSCIDISSRGVLLPPKDSVVKYILVTVEELRPIMPGATHLIISGASDQVMPKSFVLIQKCVSSPSTVLPLPWLKTTLKVPKGHCSLTNISFPHLTKMVKSYQADVGWSSNCGEGGGISGGLVVPWYPHTSLSHSTLTPLSISLDILAPPRSSLTTHPPYLLLWNLARCELEVTVTSDPLALLDKLAIVYAPLLLPWVTSLCISASSRWITLELLLLEILYLSTSYGWFPQLTDWVELSPLWNGWGPLMLHLISYGLQQLIFILLSLISRIFHTCHGGSGGRWYYASLGLLLVSGGLSYGVCSGIGPFLSLIAIIIQGKECLVNISGVLICLQLLTIPSLVTWARGMRHSVYLTSDPHANSVLVCIFLVLAILLCTTRRNGGEGGGEGDGKRFLPVAVITVESGLGLAALCTCLLHAYRLTGFIVLYFLLTLLSTNIL